MHFPAPDPPWTKSRHAPTKWTQTSHLAPLTFSADLTVRFSGICRDHTLDITALRLLLCGSMCTMLCASAKSEKK